MLSMFMLFWRGYGWLTLLFIGLPTALGISLAEAAQIPEGYAIAFTLLVAALANWLLGRSLNATAADTVLVDPKTGMQYATNSAHTLFGFKMQSWSIILVIGALAPLLLQATGNYQPGMFDTHRSMSPTKR
jgi:hypothetical protein